MIELALVKILLFSVLMLGAIRLFVVVFLGDSSKGPAIGAISRRIAESPEMKSCRRRSNVSGRGGSVRPTFDNAPSQSTSPSGHWRPMLHQSAVPQSDRG